MRALLRCLITALALCGAVATPAAARTQVTPYLEYGQVLTAEIKGGNEVLTYSQLVAGIDAASVTARTQSQVSARYERRIAWNRKTLDGDTISGLARTAHKVAPGFMTLEGGAIASQTRLDGRGRANDLSFGSVDTRSQVYGAYIGPNVQTDAGPFEVQAAYRLSYARVDGDDVVLAGGQQRIEAFEDSVGHLATASVGMGARDHPFGWTVSGAFEREDAGQLDQRFESKRVRGDLIVPVSPTVALVGGIGHEDIEASQRAPLLDLSGAPIINGNGHLVTDPASPRLLAYDQDGLYWDAGVLWRPSRRTSLEARVGRRYGSMSYTGSLSYAPDASTAAAIVVYDDVQTFGQQLSDNLALLPTSFTTIANPLASQFNGCTFSAVNGQPGTCLNPLFQAISGSVYRVRGVTAVAARQRGRWSFGAGAGYSTRKFHAPVIPGASFILDGKRDEFWFAETQIGYRIDEKSAVDGQFFASLHDSGLMSAPNVVSTGITGSYRRIFGRRLTGIAAVGLYSDRVQGLPGELDAAAQIAVRYSF